MSPSRKSAPSAMVGLDIGTDSIKVAEARFGKDGLSVTALGIAKTPPGVIENEVIVDPKALGGAIKALLAESGIKTKKCVSSVSGASQVVVRVISVPKMKREELAETMKWEVERHVPFSPQEVVMDFQPLDNPAAAPDSPEMEVLLAVAQQGLVDSHVEALLAAGLQPVAIDIEPLATSRSLIELSQNGAKAETVAVVNIGSTRTDLGIFENGLLTFPSPPLGVAGINFTREISEAMGQTLEQAEVTKREFAAVHLGAAPPPPDASAQAAPPPAPEPDASAEPTIAQEAFDTSVGPEPGLAGGFDLGDVSAPAAEPAAPAEPAASAEPVAPAEPAAPAAASGFVDTLDGPVFDIDDIGPAAAAPAEPAEPEPSAAPVFDLGGPDRDAPISSGPSFDLGGDEPAAPAAPTFDLADDEPETQGQAGDQAAPSFDLGDVEEQADHSIQAAASTPAPASAPIPLDDDSTEGQVFQAISGVLTDLANELRMSLEYYTNRYSKMPQQVYLCGGTAKMPKLDEFLSRELGLPVAVADPIKNLPVRVPGASPQYLNEISPLLCVCIGLAVRDMIG